MIIQFHTPKGIIHIDSDTVTDSTLAIVGVTREALNKLIPKDILAELDNLKARLEKLEK